MARKSSVPTLAPGYVVHCLRGVFDSRGNALWLRGRVKRGRVFGGRGRHSHNCAARGKYTFSGSIDRALTFIATVAPGYCGYARPFRRFSGATRRDWRALRSGQYCRGLAHRLLSRLKDADDAILRDVRHRAPLLRRLRKKSHGFASKLVKSLIHNLTFPFVIDDKLRHVPLRTVADRVRKMLATPRMSNVHNGQAGPGRRSTRLRPRATSS
jgi:hypothetical protein